jgi:hypothetical protein
MLRGLAVGDWAEVCGVSDLDERGQEQGCAKLRLRSGRGERGEERHVLVGRYLG